MLKVILNPRNLLMFAIIAVVSWTQWKIYTQEKTISDLTSSLKDSQQKVSDLTADVEDLRTQMRIDRESVEDWFNTTTKFTDVQLGYQTEVENVLTKFRYELAVNAKKPEPQNTVVNIRPDIASSAINGMWNAYASTQSLNGPPKPDPTGVPEKSTGSATTGSRSVQPSN